MGSGKLVSEGRRMRYMMESGESRQYYLEYLDYLKEIDKEVCKFCKEKAVCRNGSVFLCSIDLVDCITAKKYIKFSEALRNDVDPDEDTVLSPEMCIEISKYVPPISPHPDEINRRLKWWRGLIKERGLDDE